jgi:class 3 adenylate cyclase
MVGSSSLVNDYPAEFAASVFKSYLHLAAKVIRDSSGKIVSYDGDRIMAVYQGLAIARPAVRSALQLNYLVEEIIQPELNAAYPLSNFSLKHCVGIDIGEVMAVQAGIRGSSDLVWVGNVANVAAKLADVRAQPSIIVTPDVFREIPDEQRSFPNGAPIWHSYPFATARSTYVYGSSAWEQIP